MAPAQRNRPLPDADAVRCAEDLLLAAVSCPSEGAARSRLDSLASGGADWPLVLGLARRHGVAPLLNAALARHELHGAVPAEVAAALRHSASGAAATVLLRDTAVAESLRALEAAGYRPLVIRGPVLGHRFYDTASLRPSDDVDVLVPPECWSELLDDVRGWRHSLHLIAFRLAARRHDKPACVDPAQLDDPAFRRWLAKACTPWGIATVDRHRIVFEFHFDLFPRALVDVRHSDLWAASRQVELPGVTARTLAQPELLIELCLHAVKHYDAGGTRLLWFCDIDRVVRADGAHLNWTHFFERARELGAHAASYYALRLAADLLGTPVPQDALASARPSGIGDRLVGRNWPRYLRPLLRRTPPGSFTPYQWVMDPWGSLTSRFSLGSVAELFRAIWPSRGALYLRYGVNGSIRPYLRHLVHLPRAMGTAAAARRARRG